MLQIATDKVCYILVKARVFDAKVEAAEPERGTKAPDDRFVEVLEEYRDDATFAELKAFLDQLNEDEQIDLVALAWVGRGDYSAQEWTQARADALYARTTHQHSSEYLLGMPLLGDYLEQGLTELGLTCEGVELSHL